MNRHTLKLSLFAALAAVSLQSCALLLPELFGAQGGPRRPSFELPTGESKATSAWRLALAEKGQDIDALFAILDEVPGPASLAPEQHAIAALDLLARDTLEGLAADCATGSFRSEEVAVKASLKAEVACPRIAQRAALLRQNARAWGEQIIEHVFRQEQADTEAIARDRLIPARLLQEQEHEALRTLMDRALSRARKTFERLGEPVPVELLARANGVIQARREVIRKLAIEGKLEKAASSDPAAERAIREVYARRFDVERVLMVDGQWRPLKDDLGLLRGRTKNAAVVVKARDGSFCARMSAAVSNTYEGGGKFSRRQHVDVFIFATPVTCP